MVRFINEIILKYLLGISKCTKLPGKKQTNKQKNPKQYLRTNTSLHIRHIYISEIILATSLKLFFQYYYHFSWKKKVSPHLYWIALLWAFGLIQHWQLSHKRMRFLISFQVRKKKRIINNSYVPSSILELILISLLRIQCFNIIQQDKGKTL